MNCYNISNLQDASVLQKNTHEISIAYNHISYQDFINEKNSTVSNCIVGLWDYGLFRNIATRVKYELIIPHYQYLSEIHFFSFGVKYSLINNRLSLYVPVGTYLNKELFKYHIVNFCPGLIFSIPISSSIKMNFSLSEEMFINKIDAATILTLGIDIHVRSLILRPEVGFASNPGFSGIYFSPNFGVTFVPK